jgi:hypothetical protein
MKHPDKIPRIQRLLSLPHECNRNCEEPVKGQARWRGSLRSPLTEPSQFPPTPPLWKRKKKTEMSIARCPFPQRTKGHWTRPQEQAVFSVSCDCFLHLATNGN